MLLQLGASGSSRACRRAATPRTIMAVANHSRHKTTFSHLPLSTTGPIDCAVSGAALLNTSYLNKGSAFSEDEREEFNLVGLLPEKVNTLDQQARRAYDQYSVRRSAIGKNTFMMSMKDQNEVLYYRLIQDHLKEMFPVIYTPTQGDAIANFSHLFRRPEGAFLNVQKPDDIEQTLARFGGEDDIDIIVCSDGEQILGIGDQGVGAVLISVAKLALYTACAGIHPHRTLPVGLDCGTNNQELLDDPLYLGLRHKRVRGEQYDEFIDRFVKACRKRFPKAMIHFEDFGLANASRILDKYTPEIACFNDDIQGTGCVTLAALFAASSILGRPLKDSRVLMFGAGSAGLGIAGQIADAIAVEGEKDKSEAYKQIFCIDRPGLLLESDSDKLTSGQKPYAKPDADFSELKDKSSLADIISVVKPHILIGACGVPKVFTKEGVQEMAKHVERPIIFPLSNPTRLCEAVPQDLYDWTNGKVLTATGSPFDAVTTNGKQVDIAQCNNSAVFPGIGLGAVLCRPRLITPSLLVAAVKALSETAPAFKDPTLGLLPDLAEVKHTSVMIAKGIIKQAVEEDLNQIKDIPTEDDELEEWIKEQMWKPEYRALKRVHHEDADRAARGEAGAKGVDRT
ncbi:hypothetical protein AMS68_004262 [Peltaster fructicola]|uniref:Malic enzyme n=1 Tax=Peltaster fructicola TaxID=286661 RepID=A0A6H0XVR1_9PEZI|nr:hypothetical protein AMS68_004262 [Peltaster fructicola]